MLLYIPTGTDAPLYHPPIATCGLIGLNIVVFIFQVLFPDINDSLILIHGDLNPIQWLTSAIMHGGIFHLIGNMLSFAIFGWIVEGKVGWWRTILIYFGIATLSNGFEQFLFLFISSSGNGSLGASGVIFGFMAIALLWAPENQITLTYFFWMLFYVSVGTFEVSIAGYCFFMMGVEAFIVWFSFFRMSSALLHMMGAIPGFLIGYLMIKFRRVNCDGYDLFSIWAGREGKATLTVAEEKAEEIRKQEAREQLVEQTSTGQQQIEHYLELGQHEFAMRRLQLLKKSNPRFVLPEKSLVKMIRAFDSAPKNREQMVPLIQTYLKHYQHNKNAMTLMLARHYVVDKESPRKSLGFLKTVDQGTLTPKEKKVFKAIVGKAQQMIRDGVLEVGE